MRIYVAAPWVRRDEAAAAATLIQAKGHTVTHDWWNHEVADDDHPTLRQHAQADMRAVWDANCLVLLNLEKSEGKAVETGIAIALGKRLMGVRPSGTYTNIFQHLPYWEWYESVEELLAHL